jgi:hypothetical protein
MSIFTHVGVVQLWRALTGGPHQPFSISLADGMDGSSGVCPSVHAYVPIVANSTIYRWDGHIRIIYMDHIIQLAHPSDQIATCLSTFY